VVGLPNTGAPQAIDLGLDRLHVVLERLRVAAAADPRHHRRRHERQGLRERVLRGHHARRQACGSARLPPRNLRSYQERIRIHDRLARADELVAVFERIEAARGSVVADVFSSSTRWQRY